MNINVLGVCFDLVYLKSFLLLVYILFLIILI